MLYMRELVGISRHGSENARFPLLI